MVLRTVLSRRVMAEFQLHEERSARELAGCSNPRNPSPPSPRWIARSLSHPLVDAVEQPQRSERLRGEHLQSLPQQQRC